MPSLAIARVKALVSAVISPRELSHHKAASTFGQPVMAFGAVLLAMIWGGASLLMFEDSHALRSKAERDAINFARVAQQNVVGKLRGVDEKLRFLRWLDKREGFQTDWPTLFSDSKLLASDDAEVAVVDRAGFLVASNLTPHPAKLIDFSDRPYFAEQSLAVSDALFVGPVTGEPNGERTVHISLKRVDAEGAFRGVFVFTLSADYFDRQFAGLDLGVDGGLALVGDDGRIRSGSGALAARLGEPWSEVSKDFGDGFTGERRIAGFPLFVVSRVSPIETNAGWRMRRALIIAGSMLATLLTIAATIRVARRRTRFEEEILHLSRHDTLTGLPNRHALSRELEGLYGDGAVDFALHVIDLDRFKTVNDTYGHLIGDELLRLASARLTSLMGEYDMVARLGGDEFAILQRVVNFEVEAMALARRVNHAMARPFETSRLTLSIGATIGVAQGRRDGETAVELMKAADLALYAAKGDGRGCARLFNRALTESTIARVELERGLQTALARDELYIDYQPIHGLRRQGLSGYEALMRWRRGGGALVPPNQFIPIAEDLGLIIEIGAWAMKRACADIAALPGDLEVSVNVSPVQLDAGRLAADVREALEASRLPARRLRIEITESALLRDKPVVSEQIRMLREMGVGVSLDDFGTGYSCLSYLEMYPIDTLKIDQRFVRKLGTRPEAVATLRAIVDLARSYGMKTVAEGVETEEQLRTLREIGCDRAQGYLLGRPAPLPKIDVAKLGSAA